MLFFKFLNLDARNNIAEQVTGLRILGSGAKQFARLALSN